MTYLTTKGQTHDIFELTGPVLFPEIQRVKKENKSAVFIDHNIIHVYGAADRFIILDRGEVVGEFDKDQISREELVQKMIQSQMKI